MNYSVGRNAEHLIYLFKRPMFSTKRSFLVIALRCGLKENRLANLRLSFVATSFQSYITYYTLL